MGGWGLIDVFSWGLWTERLCFCNLVQCEVIVKSEGCLLVGFLQTSLSELFRVEFLIKNYSICCLKDKFNCLLHCIWIRINHFKRGLISAFKVHHPTHFSLLFGWVSIHIEKGEYVRPKLMLFSCFLCHIRQKYRNSNNINSRKVSNMPSREWYFYIVSVTFFWLFFYFWLYVMKIVGENYTWKWEKNTRAKKYGWNFIKRKIP